MNRQRAAAALREFADALLEDVPQDTGDRLLRYREVAQRLGIKESTARERGRRGAYGPERMQGADPYILLADLTEAIRTMPTREPKREEPKPAAPQPRRAKPQGQPQSLRSLI